MSRQKGKRLIGLIKKLILTYGSLHSFFVASSLGGGGGGASTSNNSSSGPKQNNSTSRQLARSRARIMRATSVRGSGSQGASGSSSRSTGVIIGSSSSNRSLVTVPAPFVPEELVSQAQVVLQGKSRNVIIRELQVSDRMPNSPAFISNTKYVFCSFFSFRLDRSEQIWMLIWPLIICCHVMMKRAKTPKKAAIIMYQKI